MDIECRSLGLRIQAILLPSLPLHGFAAGTSHLRKNHHINQPGQRNVVIKYRALHAGLCPAPFGAQPGLNQQFNHSNIIKLSTEY
ncbi:MAG: hypothetical protein WCS62_05910 [Bacilli bacterium]|jgi:hypothetical protein